MSPNSSAPSHSSSQEDSHEEPGEGELHAELPGDVEVAGVGAAGRLVRGAGGGQAECYEKRKRDRERQLARGKVDHAHASEQRETARGPLAETIQVVDGEQRDDDGGRQYEHCERAWLQGSEPHYDDHGYKNGEQPHWREEDAVGGPAARDVGLIEQVKQDPLREADDAACDSYCIDVHADYAPGLLI